MDARFLARAVELALANVRDGWGGPFGAVVVSDGVILGEGANSVIPMNDPTAHAEVVAIRRACQTAGAVHLAGSVLYASCEPCPMCLGAVYWAHIDRVYFAATKAEASDAGFADSDIYRELGLAPAARSIPMIRADMGEAGLEPFRAWLKKEDRKPY